MTPIRNIPFAHFRGLFVIVLHVVLTAMKSCTLIGPFWSRGLNTRFWLAVWWSDHVYYSATHQHPTVRTNSFVCASDFRVLRLTAIFGGSFLIICCILATDRKSASRSSTFSQCWAKCRHRISSLRCFHSELLVSSELYWSNSSSPPRGVAPVAHKFRLIACPGFVVRVNCSRWTS